MNKRSKKKKNKEILDLLAHGRGQRIRLAPRIVPDKSKHKRAHAQYQDQLKNY